MTSKFSLDDSKKTPLKTFLQKKALEFDREELVKTYVLVDESQKRRILGYISIICSEINIDGAQDIDENLLNNKYKIFSAIKIARLAVDKALQGQGYGSKMVAWCLSLVIDKIMPIVGCRFLIVDAKPDVVKFYEHIGFTMLDTPKNKQSEHPLMYMDLYRMRGIANDTLAGEFAEETD